MYRIVTNNGDMFDIDADKAEDYGDELLFCRNNDKDRPGLPSTDTWWR